MRGEKGAAKKELRKMKKFRFELLAEWLAANFLPCRVADVGGGKGLLALLLIERGFEATVIDPHDQALPAKYRSLGGERHKIAGEVAVPRRAETFEAAMAADFDLLVGMHAHGSNMKIIEAAAALGKSFALMPCCVIDEPVVPRANVDWFESLEEHARGLGLETARFELNFRGQCRGFATPGTRPPAV